MWQKWNTPELNQSPLSPEKALSLIISLNLSKEQYMVLRLVALENGHNLFPPYNKILEAKKAAYPQDLIINERKCEVSLQSLLDNTCERILSSCDFISIDSLSDKIFTLYCKWGFDGSSGYSMYKQAFSEENLSDESIFITSLVPVRIVQTTDNKVVWTNPKPSSTKFCRPIRYQLQHETEEISIIEEEYINRQIKALRPFKSDFGTINFNMMLTMVDGKVSHFECLITNYNLTY